MTEIPVIVLNWEGWDDTFECLRSLRDASDATTVWLVDNGSTVDRTDEARAVYPGLRIIRLDQNYGFAGGMNRALRLAAAEGYAFAYLLNNDTTVVAGFLEAARDAISSPQVAVVGSRITGHGKSNGLLVFDGQYYRDTQKAVDDWSGSRQVKHVNGAGMLVRITALEREGYFDERFFCYHEEHDLCRRLSRAGWRIAVAGSSLILHKRQGSDRSANAIYYRVRNRFLALEQQRGWSTMRRRLIALEYAARVGRRSRKLRNTDDWKAVAAGVYDGVRGRFGQRFVCDNLTAATVLLWLTCAALPSVERLRALRRWLAGSQIAERTFGHL